MTYYRSEDNIVEAISNGAIFAAKTIATLIIQIIAFVSFYTFINVTVRWFGARIGIELSLEVNMVVKYCLI